ncbi:MAG: hypothetical protein NTZ83_02305 [Candidatus Pacearchaeota archaeon]|nr:hypothetical protein [Candidatus Pacearchaeota archaeon]
MINEKVYKKLIGIAKRKNVIPYEDLVIDCNLPINLDNVKGRNELSKTLGEISTEEFKHKRPLISVLVVLKNQHPIIPSYGFFTLVDELGVRKPGETNEQVRNRLMNEVYRYWFKK